MLWHRRATRPDTLLPHATLLRSVAAIRAIRAELGLSGAGETREEATGRLLQEHGLTVAVAGSLTGGLGASRIVSVPGSSGWFRGAVVAYDSQVTFDVPDVPEGPVVSEEPALALAEDRKSVE